MSSTGPTMATVQTESGDGSRLLVWIAIALGVGSLGLMLWASDKITYEGERTIYTVACEQGSWDGLRCGGKMVAGKRYRFKASRNKQEVLFWVVGSPEPSGKYSKCTVQDRGNWKCDVAANDAASVTREMVNGRPAPDPDNPGRPFYAVPKWEWWLLDAGMRIYSRAGY